MTTRGQGADVILVVDDENYARLLTKTVLERAGFEVTTASDGQEAIDLFRDNDDTVGLIVLDLRLPIKTGAEVYTELRAEYPRLPIIISSGRDRQIVSEEFPDDPLMEFVQKPYQPTKLIGTVRQLLGVHD